MAEDFELDDDLELGLPDWDEERLQPYTIGGATEAQEAAIREMAAELGFENLRGFHMYMKSRDLDYYDIIRSKYE